MKYFDDKLNGILIAEDTDERAIYFGTYALMEELRNRELETRQYTKKPSHPEASDLETLHSRNPDALVAMDDDSKIRGMGTHNCITCRHFNAGQLCFAWLKQRGKKVVLNQHGVKQFDFGGCILQDMLPRLGDIYNLMSPLYEKIIHLAVEDGLLVKYSDGDVKSFSPEQLGIEYPEDPAKEWQDEEWQDEEWQDEEWQDDEWQDDEEEDWGYEDNY